MSDTQNIVALIIDFLDFEVLSIDEKITPKDNLLSSGLVDSVSMMRLITHLEVSLDLKIPPSELVPKNFLTPQVIAKFLQSLLREPALV